jgi:hypothetical protein
VACGKCNDARPFETFAMKLVDGVYQFDPTFDLESWSADVEGKRSPDPKCTIQDIADFLETQPDKSATQREIAEHCGVAVGTVNKRVKAGQKPGYFKITTKGVKSTGKLPPRAKVEHFEEEI